jgi:hypothetical protein
VKFFEHAVADFNLTPKRQIEPSVDSRELHFGGYAHDKVPELLEIMRMSGLMQGATERTAPVKEESLRHTASAERLPEIPLER